MKIAVCDDDVIYRKYISNLLNMYSKRLPQYDIIFSIYEHADDLLDAAKKTGGFDIYILHVVMPNTNVVELGILLRENGYDGKIIESSTIHSSFREETIALIEDEHFVMCGVSVIVNLLHIIASKTNELIFCDGSSIQMSRKLLAEIRIKWMEYWIHEQ